MIKKTLYLLLFAIFILVVVRWAQGASQKPADDQADDYPVNILRTARAATMRITDTSTEPMTVGTATIIGYDKDGHVLLLTARHLVLSPRLKLDVEAFPSPGTKPTKFTGKAVTLMNSTAADLALLRFTPDGDTEANRKPPPEFATSLRICPLEQAPTPPSPVWVIGCPQGATPRWLTTHLLGTTTHKGGSFWRTKREPIVGESGGAMIDPENGYLIGVCSAADQGTGLFASLDEVWNLLDKAGLASLQQPQTEKPPPNRSAPDATRKPGIEGMPQRSPSAPREGPADREVPARRSPFDLRIELRSRPDGACEVTVQRGAKRFNHVLPP